MLLAVAVCFSRTSPALASVLPAVCTAPGAELSWSRADVAAGVTQRAYLLLGPDTCHVYRIEGGADRPAAFVVDQAGIDIALALSDRGSIAVHDMPTGRVGAEIVYLSPTAAQPLLVYVYSRDNTTRSRRYAATLVVQLEEPDDRAYALAARASEGPGDSVTDTERLLRHAEAAEAWRQAGRSDRFAMHRYAQGRLARDEGEIDQSIGFFREALDSVAAGSARNALRADLALSQIAAQDPAAAEITAVEGLGDLGRRPDPDDAVWLAIVLGLARQYGGDLEAALSAYADAEKRMTTETDPDLRAMLANNRGGIHYERGEPVAAMAAFESAAEVFEATGNDLERAHVRTNMAFLAMRIGEYDRALGLLWEARDVFAARTKEADLAWVDYGIGLAYLGLGDLETSEAFLSAAATVQRQAGSASRLAFTLLYLGDIARHRGELGRARGLHEEALGRIDAEASPVLRTQLALSLALDDLAEGKGPGAAERIDVALDALAADGNHRMLGELHTVRSEARLAVRDFPGALADAQAGIQSAEAASDRRLLARAEGQLARVHAEQGDLTLALAAVESAITSTEAVRARVSWEELRATYLAGVMDLYEMRVRLQMALHDREPRAGWDARAFRSGEQARARSLRELLREGGVDDRMGLAPELAVLHAQLTTEHTAKLVAYRKARDVGSPQAEAYARDTRRTAAALRATEAELAERSPLSLDRGPNDMPGLAQVRRHLDSDTTLIAYFTTATESFAWVVRRSGHRTLRLAAGAEIEAAVANALASLESPVHGADAALGVLAELIVEPLLPALAGDRLLIVPHGSLDYVPFSALPVPGSDNARVYLGDRHTISRLPAVILPEPSESRSPLDDPLVLAVADPVFGSDDERLTALAPDARRVNRRDTGFARLPYSRIEAEQLSTLLPEGRFELLSGFDATKQALLGRGSYGQILHLATHARADETQPALSGLAVTAVGPGGEAIDGFLSLPELYRFRHDASLVVLSGCSTAVGRRIRGEGLESLERAFLLGGADTVVASLWPVSDNRTAALMRSFYTGLLHDRVGVATALRQAQAEVRENPRFRHPYYWAGFVVTETDISGEAKP